MDCQREYDVLEKAAIYLQEAEEWLAEIYSEQDPSGILWHTDCAYQWARLRLNMLKHAMAKDKR